MRPLVALVASVALAACAGVMTLPLEQSLRPDAKPPLCQGEHTTKKYGAHTAKLKTSGGSLCVPEFAGFGGSIEYPAVETAVELTIRTSKKNIYQEPQLGAGTSLVYLNLHFHAGTHFSSSFKSKGGLMAKEFRPGATYSAFGIVTVGHLSLMFSPCYAVAAKGPYGGVIPNLGQLFAGTTITGNGYGVIEVYSGMQTSQEC